MKKRLLWPVLLLAVALLIAGLWLGRAPGDPPSSLASTEPAPLPSILPPPTATFPPPPTSAPTPSFTTRQISGLAVGPDGQVAHVEGRRLLVTAAGQSRVVTDQVAPGVPLSAWSPDGRWLLYAAGDGVSHRLRLWDAHAGASLDLDQTALAGVEIGRVAWSPDGARLALIADPLHGGVWLLDVDTRAARQLATSEVALDAIWAGDGAILVAGQRTLTLFDAAAPLAPLGDAAIDVMRQSGALAPSPDGRYLAGLGRDESGRARPQVVPLPNHSAPVVTFPITRAVALTQPPLWSPDGRWVAFALAVDGELDPVTALLDATGGASSHLLPGLLPLAWSPDGRKLAGASCTDRACGPVVVDAPSGHVEPVAQRSGARLIDLAWSPQATHLAYSLAGDGSATLEVWERAAGALSRLMTGEDGGSFTDLQWSPEGCHVYAAQRSGAGDTVAIWGFGPDWSARWRVAPSDLAEHPPVCPASELPGRRLVAYYGTCAGPGLGILGRHDVTATLTLLAEQIAVYAALEPEVEYVPVLHMVTTIADPYPGDEGVYNHRVDHATIRRWIDGGRAAGSWIILDLQPAHADIDLEIDLVESFLHEPNVHLAVDPEFVMAEAGHVPGNHMGRITGAQINRIQARLDRIARATGQRRLLVIHQFVDRMVEGKDEILDYTLVDLVWDADGFGPPWPKVADYVQYAGEPGFEYGGFKLFYDYDVPLMTPEEVLRLVPRPALIIYQ